MIEKHLIMSNDHSIHHYNLNEKNEHLVQKMISHIICHEIPPSQQLQQSHNEMNQQTIHNDSIVDQVEILTSLHHTYIFFWKTNNKLF